MNTHSNLTCRWCQRTGFNRPQGRAAHERMCTENPANRTASAPATFGAMRKRNGNTVARDASHGAVIAASTAVNITAAQGVTTLITELHLKREFLGKQLAAEVEARDAVTARIDGLERGCADVEREIGLLQSTLDSLTGTRATEPEPDSLDAAEAPEVVLAAGN